MYNVFSYCYPSQYKPNFTEDSVSQRQISACSSKENYRVVFINKLTMFNKVVPSSHLQRMLSLILRIFKIIQIWLDIVYE